MKAQLFIIVLCLCACNSEQASDKAKLISGIEYKEWNLTHSSRNGIKEQYDPAKGNFLSLTFYADGSYGSPEHHDVQWSLSIDRDSLLFQMNDPVHKGLHKAEIVKLSKDTLVTRSLVNGKTIIQHYSKKEI